MESPAQKPHLDSLASPWSSQVRGPRSLPPRFAGCRCPSGQSPGQSGTRHGHRVSRRGRRVSRLEFLGHLSASLFLTFRSVTVVVSFITRVTQLLPTVGKGMSSLPPSRGDSKLKDQNKGYTQEITFSESTGNTALKSCFRKPPPPPTSHVGSLQRDALP